MVLIGRKLLSLFKCPRVISSGEVFNFLCVINSSQIFNSLHNFLDLLHVTSKWIMVSSWDLQILQWLSFDFPVWYNNLLVPRIWFCILYWNQIMLLSLIVLKHMRKLLSQVALSMKVFKSMFHLFLHLFSKFSSEIILYKYLQPSFCFVRRWRRLGVHGLFSGSNGQLGSPIYF